MPAWAGQGKYGIRFQWGPVAAPAGRRLDDRRFDRVGLDIRRTIFRHPVRRRVRLQICRGRGQLDRDRRRADLHGQLRQHRVELPPRRDVDSGHEHCFMINLDSGETQPCG